MRVSHSIDKGTQLINSAKLCMATLCQETHSACCPWGTWAPSWVGSVLWQRTVRCYPSFRAHRMHCVTPATSWSHSRGRCWCSDGLTCFRPRSSSDCTCGPLPVNSIFISLFRAQTSTISLFFHLYWYKNLSEISQAVRWLTAQRLRIREQHADPHSVQCCRAVLRAGSLEVRAEQQVPAECTGAALPVLWNLELRVCLHVSY